MPCDAAGRRREAVDSPVAHRSSMFDQRVGRRPEVAAEHPRRSRRMRVVDEADRVSHAAVMDAFRRRDPEAVRVLYREYGRLVYAVAHRVLGRRDLAEDAVQQTFVNAWQAADRFDVTRDPASWLATIARRSAIDIYRREQRRPASELADVATDDPAVVSLPP